MCTKIHMYHLGDMDTISIRFRVCSYQDYGYIIHQLIPIILALAPSQFWGLYKLINHQKLFKCVMSSLTRAKNALLYYKCILIDESLIHVHKLLMHSGAPICNIIFELYESVLNISYSYSLKIVCHL